MHLPILSAAVILAPAPRLPASDPRALSAAMVRELLKRNDDPRGRPLPVVSHWANGFDRPTFSSDYQIGLLERGRHIVPTIPFPRPGSEAYPEAGRPWIEKLARWRAPIALRAGQWESVLYSKEHPRDAPGKWRRLPPEESPLLVNREGEIEPWLSPFGAIAPWYEAGFYNTRSGAFAQLEAWYPDPPFVILLSNNEARRLKPKHGVEARSGRYVERHGTGTPAEAQRRAMAEGYRTRYAALLRGIRDGLASEVWRRASLLVGYGAFGPPHFGRWDDWAVHSLATRERIDPWHLVWEGGSPSYYTHNWNESTDYRVHSPQIEAMNWVFMLREAYAERPAFWFEISVWDGNPAGPSKYGRKMDRYIAAGQTWSPARYAGFVAFGLWLLRPRCVREFRGSTMPRARFARQFEALIAAVDRVWTDPTLRRFWRHGELVPNRKHAHPYRSRIPAKWKDADRWFLLDTSLDPPRPWRLDTEIPVFALARVIGRRDRREWLLYAHAPVTARRAVKIAIPGFGPVTVDVARGGSFYHVRAAARSVAPIAEAR